tara:strand:- start:2461 stop:3138 length:678 start_codon:yes stop_codon:yes gene_type:complete
MTTPEFIEELLQEVEEAEEPGNLREGQVLHRSNDDMPLGVQVASVASAGHVFIYNTKTGDRSKTNRNMLEDQLKKVFPEDGSRVYTTVKPPFEPPRGTYMCLLHADNAEREHYDAMGLARCTKDDLASEYQVQRHMQTRHRMEWATIAEERDRAERDEERQFQRTLMAAVARVGEDRATASSVSPIIGTNRAGCAQCDKTFKSQAGMKLHVRLKHQEVTNAIRSD